MTALKAVACQLVLRLFHTGHNCGKNSKNKNNEKPEESRLLSDFLQTETALAVTLLCVAVEVLVVWVSVLVGDFSMDCTPGICGKTKLN